MVDYKKLQDTLDQIEHYMDECNQLLSMSRAFDSQVPCLGACSDNRLQGRTCADDTCVCWCPCWRPIREAPKGERFLFWDAQSGIEVIGRIAVLRTMTDNDAEVIIGDDNLKIIGTTAGFTHFMALPDPPFDDDEEASI